MSSRSCVCCFRLWLGMALAAAALAGLGPTSGRAEEKYTTDSPEQIQKALAEKKAILVDVREPEEWKAGHLRDAHLLPTSQMRQAEKLRELTKDWDKSKVIYTHCRAGKRAINCAPLLRELGFEVRPIKTGYEGLLNSGFPKAEEKTAD